MFFFLYNDFNKNNYTRSYWRIYQSVSNSIHFIHVHSCPPSITQVSHSHHRRVVRIGRRRLWFRIGHAAWKGMVVFIFMVKIHRIQVARTEFQGVQGQSFKTDTFLAYLTDRNTQSRLSAFGPVAFQRLNRSVGRWKRAIATGAPYRCPVSGTFVGRRDNRITALGTSGLESGSPAIIRSQARGTHFIHFRSCGSATLRIFIIFSDNVERPSCVVFDNQNVARIKLMMLHQVMDIRLHLRLFVCSFVCVVALSKCKRGIGLLDDEIRIVRESVDWCEILLPFYDET